MVLELFLSPLSQTSPSQYSNNSPVPSLLRSLLSLLPYHTYQPRCQDQTHLLMNYLWTSLQLFLWGHTVHCVSCQSSLSLSYTLMA